MIVIAYTQDARWFFDKTEPELFCAKDCDTMLVPDDASNAEITERVRIRLERRLTVVTKRMNKLPLAASWTLSITHGLILNWGVKIAN